MRDAPRRQLRPSRATSSLLYEHRSSAVPPWPPHPKSLPCEGSISNTAPLLPCYRRPMPRWMCTLSYNGTDLHGWQVQPGLPTVQGHLADALQRITGEHTLPVGSGRTDAGVHALAQVATFDLQTPIPAANLLRALNRVLPASIRVLTLAPVAPTFHARHSARSKTYEYRIFPRRPCPDSIPRAPDRICCPMLAPFVWDCPVPLHLESLQRATAHVLGTHDFTSFAAAGSDALNPDRQPYSPADAIPDYPVTPPTPCRTILASSWHRSAEDLLTYRVTGSGFLHHMVRNLVGTFVEVGSGRRDPDSIPAVLAARDRRAAGPTAPARGLFLVEVHYA